MMMFLYLLGVLEQSWASFSRRPNSVTTDLHIFLKARIIGHGLYISNPSQDTMWLHKLQWIHSWSLPFFSLAWYPAALLHLQAPPPHLAKGQCLKTENTKICDNYLQLYKQFCNQHKLLVMENYCGKPYNQDNLFLYSKWWSLKSLMPFALNIWIMLKNNVENEHVTKCIGYNIHYLQKNKKHNAQHKNYWLNMKNLATGKLLQKKDKNGMECYGTDLRTALLRRVFQHYFLWI